jgi:putative two-component system response regulator
MINERDAIILVVDDDQFIVDYLSRLLTNFGYKFITSDSALTAIEMLAENKVDVVLTDIKMPGVTGLGLLDKIYQSNPDMPVILMTGYAELGYTIEAIQKRAFDFIQKPFKPEQVINSVARALRHCRTIDIEKKYKAMLENAVKVRTEELSKVLADLDKLNAEIILRLATVAEFRDNESAAHFSRISLYVNKIAEAMDFDAVFIETITLASKLHDIGKIAIPDNILLKPEALTQEEWLTMKSHTITGHKILSESKYKVLQVAASIALNHHERWDGTGYPRGMKGTDIPIEGRIVIICDQYDAIRSRRHYKKGIGHSEALKILTEGDDRTEPNHFDPVVLNAFTKISSVFDEIFESYQD